MKIDTSKIEGYEEMSAEDKLKALEAFEVDVPEPDYTGYVKKDLYDKTASELSAKKKELADKLTDEEKAKKEQEERQTELENKYNALLRENSISKNKSQLLALGYEEKLADDTAEAMADGDLDKVFKNQKKHLEAVEKKVRAEVLKDTPEPTGDGGTATVTLKELRAMSPADRLKFSQEHPEEYKTLYTGGATE